jgi:putative iron-regulated protein
MKNNYTKNLGSTILLLLLAIMIACSDDSSNPVDPEEQDDFSKIIESYADNVVVATYEDLKDNSILLKNAVETLRNSPTQENLNIAANYWKSTREPWESSEAFLFGPVSFLSLDPSLDSWPLDQAQLSEVLSSTFELSPDFIRDGLGFALRGFHTVEYLIFRDGQPRDINSMTTRELEYLASATEVLSSDATTLYEEWINGYRNEYVAAGSSGSRYVSDVQAVQEIIEGIIGIADEVGNGKIGDPYSTKDVYSVESWFSWNSLTDFQNNIRSIQNAYTGGYHKGMDGIGLDDFIKSKNPELDLRVKTEITAAINAIAAIPEPFRNNLNADSQIQIAIEACNTIFNTFENDVKSLITN